MRRIILTCIFGFILHLVSTSQKIKDSRNYDTLTHIYKVNREQFKFIIQKNGIYDTAYLFTNSYKDYSTNTFQSDSLPDGCYIAATVNDCDVRYKLIQNIPFNIQSKIINKDAILYLYDKKTKQLINNAKLRIDNLDAPFEDGYGGYSFLYNNLDQKKVAESSIFVEINYLGQSYFVLYIFHKGYESPPSNPSYINNPISFGYLILDKPIYKPLDTLRMKSFLINNESGRPIRKRISLSLNEPLQNFNLRKKLKRKTAGAYMFDWKIPDTLRINRNYNLSLTYKKWGRYYSKTKSFYLEEYVLNKNIYDATLRSDVFLAGEDVEFYISAKDANGFPIANTQVSYTLAIQEVSKLLKDTLRIPSRRYSKWYSRDTTIDYESYSILKIPSDSLPAVNGRYALTVTITDPVTFEKKAIVLNFTKLIEKEKFLAFQVLDTLHVRSLYNLKDTAKAYTLIVISRGDTTFRNKIITPYQHKLSPYDTRAVLIDKDSNITNVTISYNQLEITKLNGKRKHDSILISFKYPFKDPIYYKIFKEDKLIKSGKGTELKFKVFDDSKSKYTIQYTSDLDHGIINNFQRITYVPQSQIIQLSSNLKQQAFPGESIAISIHAKDFYNKPLHKINIASYAINSMFESKIESPTIDVPPMYKNNIEINPVPSVHTAHCQEMPYAGNYTVKKVHIARFNLLNNEYYQIKFPKKGYTMVSMPKHKSKPEYCVIVTHGYQSYSPKYVKLNETLTYINDINNLNEYSLTANPGTYNLSFRYFDRIYTLNEIKLEKYKKHIIAVNIDSVKQGVLKIKQSDSLNPFQPVAMEKVALHESILVMGAFYFDSMKVFIDGKLTLNYPSGYYKPSIHNIDGDNYYLLGPFAPSAKLSVEVNGKEFNLKKSIKYGHFYDNILKEFKTKDLPEPKGIVFNFSENNMRQNRWIELLEKDTIAIVPTQANVNYNENNLNTQLQKQTREYFQSYNSYTGNGNFQFLVQNNNDTLWVTSLWLIHHTNSEACLYLNRVPKQPFFSFSKAGSDELYDLYLFLNNGKISILKNVHFTNDDKFYVNPLLLKSKEINDNDLNDALKIYNDLTRVPMLPFYFPPEEKNIPIRAKVDPKQKKCYLHGIITDKSYAPIESAIVLLELNGKYKAGATTNSKGEFELLNLEPASYQIKIYHPDHQIVHYSPYTFNAGQHYELLSSLNVSTMNAPIFDAIFNDFRLLAFLAKHERSVLKLQLYDYDDRSPLEQVNITIANEENSYYKGTNGKHQLELPIPKSKEGTYDIELNKAGYTPMSIDNLNLKHGYEYELVAFLHKDPKMLQSKKQFSLTMQNALPDLIEDEDDYTTYTIVKPSGPINNPGEIYGRVVDAKTGEPIDFATVTALEGGLVRAGAKTDVNGNFRLKPLAPNTYTLRVTTIGFQTVEIKKVKVGMEKSVKQNVSMEQATKTTKTVVVKEKAEKLIDYGNPGKKQMSVEEIRNLPTLSTADFSPIQAGVNQTYASPSAINIGGDRSSSTLYLIDGMQVRGNIQFKKERKKDEEPLWWMNPLDYGYSNLSAKYGNTQYADASMLNSAMQNGSSLRKSFSDVGYWQPNILTDKKGNAHFSIKLPDNITSWKSYTLAMGKKWLHGKDSSITQVYKPLQSNSVLPNFLYEGDKLYGKVRYTNLMKDPVEIKSYIMLNDKTEKSTSLQLSKQAIDSVILHADKIKRIVWNAGLSYQERYKDAEEINIPVFSTALKTYRNQQILMNKDSVYKMTFADNTNGEIILNNNIFEKIKWQIEELNKYEYRCVEQNTSRLRAMLYKQIIQKELGIKEPLNKEINSLILELETMQNTDGSFGWWRKGQAHHRMTLYAMEVLHKAGTMGYATNGALYARNYIMNQVETLNQSDLLYFMHQLKFMGLSNDEAQKRFNDINSNALSPTDKIFYYSILKSEKKFINDIELYQVFLELNNRQNSPYYDNFFFEPRADIFNSYTLFKGTSLESEWLKIFKTKLLNGQLEGNLNTFAKASMIEALTLMAQNNKKDAINATVKINDTLTVKNFPYRMAIHGKQYKFAHTGAEVYINSSEEQWNYNPSIKDSLYSVRTRFVQKGSESKLLKLGTEVSMTVDVYAYKSGDYVMIEIPIPSGVKVNKNKSIIAGASYTEYYKHKVVAFFDKLPMGQHSLTLNLIPVLSGECRVPAAKASLMYYPFVYGNNQDMSIKIE